MAEIHFVVASAGSGKTTRLANELKSALLEGEVRPEGIVATTFTNKAAAELQERARTTLLEAGRYEDAERLFAARIGTVNSVFGGFVQAHAFDLGLSPELRVIDEGSAARMLAEAISAVQTEAHEKALARPTRRFAELKWQAEVGRLIAFARSNGISAADFATHAEASVQEARALFGTPAADADVLRSRLQETLVGFLGHATSDSTKKTADVRRFASACLRKLQRGDELTYPDWVRLAVADVGKASRSIAAPLIEAASAHDHHPELIADVESVIRVVFDVAARALDAYQARKREFGVIDFVDQEALALQLLEREDVAARLRDEIDLVLIDEFQDTSPLQLALFLRLAQLARRSVWVGDQKQAIYGFRGTDPALMDDAMDGLLGDGGADMVQQAVSASLKAAPVEHLSTSYRSRPGLVHLVSDVFAAAFAPTGLAEERVRLQPALREEPKGLGAYLEHWSLELEKRGKTTDLGKAVAAGIAQLLDEGFSVRVKGTNELRPGRPSDIAVLCRTQAAGRRVAQALERAGVSAVLPRLGLFERLEGRVFLAGLRLWIDPKERRAQAELARVLDHAHDGEAWLSALLTEEAFQNQDAVARLSSLRQTHAGASLVAIVEHIIEGTGLFDLCRGLPGPGGRLANLDAIRSHAAAYAAQVEAHGMTGHAPGLYRHILALCEEDRRGKTRRDAQAAFSDEQAVVITTMHASKGLEWPVTVLFGLHERRKGSLLGVRVGASASELDLSAPLKGRTLRYLPTPYSLKSTKGVPFVDRIAESEAFNALQRRERDEALRLLYVAWTRARDRLILAMPEGKFLDGYLGVIAETAPHAITEPAAHTVWGGRPVAVRQRVYTPIEEKAALHDETRERFVRTLPVMPHAPRYRAFSGLQAVASVRPTLTRLGDRLTIHGKPDMAHLGDAMHSFLATDLVREPYREVATEARVEVARRLLERYRVTPHIAPEALLTAADRLQQHISRTWPDARLLVEWPLAFTNSEGTTLRGLADLVLETRDGFVVIDHKSFPGSEAQACERAAEYAGQLRGYAEAVTAATGRAVIECVVHMPVVGVCLGLG